MSEQARATAPAFHGLPVDVPAVRRLPDAKAMGLRLVRPVRSRASKAPFVVVVLTLLSVGLVGLIVMSTVLQAQSFQAASLHRTAAALQTKQQGLQREVEQLQSPSNVARRALVYGMVPNASPAFLRLSDGKVLGTPEAAVRGNNITRVSQ
jgi:cell division protein FtsB